MGNLRVKRCFKAAQPVETQSYSRHGLVRRAGAGATLAGGGAVYGVNYQFDPLNRRTEASLADGTWWDYGYNARSEVTSGKKKLSAGAFEGGKQFEYGFDDIGNRTVARFGGDATGANLSEAEYSAANALNQLTSREVPGSVWLTGEASTNLVLQGIAEGHAFAIERQEGERFIATELITQVRKSVTIDWTLRESARAKIRVMVRRILNRYGYPPDLQAEAVKTVLMQAELLCAEWA
jgi:hypothetical protein